MKRTKAMNAAFKAAHEAASHINASTVHAGKQHLKIIVLASVDRWATITLDEIIKHAVNAALDVAE